MGWRALLALTLWAGFADARAQDYPSPGLDCANASAPQELRICRSPRLSDLDGRHWHLAERAIRGSADREKTRSEVEGWINDVRNACQDDKCLEDGYAARIGELERKVATLAPEKPPPPPRMLTTTPAGKSAPSAPPVIATPAPHWVEPSRALAPAAAPLPKPDAAADMSYWIWALAAGVGLVALIEWKRSRKRRNTGVRPQPSKTGV